jgi:hypothetical protein
MTDTANYKSESQSEFGSVTSEQIVEALGG